MNKKMLASMASSGTRSLPDVPVEALAEELLDAPARTTRCVG